jgi:hypothetical protein
MIPVLCVFAVLAAFVLLGLLIAPRRTLVDESDLASVGRAALWVVGIVLGLAALCIAIAFGSMMFGPRHLM